MSEIFRNPQITDIIKRIFTEENHTELYHKGVEHDEVVHIFVA
jgi:hypothetical protein